MVQFINILDFMMVMPLGDDFARALDIDRAHIGYVSGAYTGAAFAAGLIGSRFLDRFDRRPALLVSVVGLAVGTALGGAATGLWSLLVARVIAGAFGGPATSLSLAVVADVVPVERRGRAMGIVMAGFSIASIFGLPAGLALARAGSWRFPFFVIAGLALVGFVIASINLPSVRGHLDGPRHRYTPMLELVRRREIALGLASACVMMMSIFLVVPNLPAYLLNNLGFPRHHYEYLYLGGGVAAFIMLQIGGRWVDRSGPIPVMSAGTAVALTAMATGFLVVPPALPIPIVFVLFMCSAPLRGVSQSTLATRLPAPSERAQYMSLQSALQHAAMTAGAVVSATILTSDPATKAVAPMWVVTAIAMSFAVLAPVVLAGAERALRRREAAAISSP